MQKEEHLMEFVMIGIGIIVIAVLAYLGWTLMREG